MPNKLASICNNIKFIPSGNSSEDCQGFVYDTQQKRAIFKPQSAISLLGTGSLCAHPTTYTWLLTKIRGSYAAQTAACNCLGTAVCICVLTCHALHPTLTCAQPTWIIPVMTLRSIIAWYPDAYQQHSGDHEQCSCFCVCLCRHSTPSPNPFYG